MARISGVDLPREKRIEIGLTYVYGIGRVRASKILEELIQIHVLRILLMKKLLRLLRLLMPIQSI